MALFDFDQLPEVSDFVKAPVFDKNLTDMTALVLKGDAIHNPLEGGLRNSIGKLNKSISKVSALQKKVQAAKEAAQNSGFGQDASSGVLGPDGLGAGVLDRASGIAASNPALDSAMAAISAGKSNMVSALGQTNRMLDHSKLMTNNIPTIGGIVNDSIAAPYRFTSESLGSLPESFPNKMPAFLRNPLGGSNIPNFGGLSLPSIPSLDLPDVSLPAMPNVANLPGVSIPGMPNPTDVLKGFSGSLAGVGPQLTNTLSSYSNNLPDLTDSVSSIVEGINIAPLNPLDGIPFTPPTLSPADLAQIADFSSLTGGIGSMGGGLGSIVGGEQAGIFSTTCSQLSLGGACAGLPSLSDASGLASSLANLSKTATSAKLVDAVATGPMKEKLANVAQEAISTTQGATVGNLVSQAQDQIGEAVATSQASAGSSVIGQGQNIVGGALSSSASAIKQAREAIGQGEDVVGGIVERGKDAITQAQTKAASAISEAQVVQKAVENASLDGIIDKIKDELPV